MFSFFISLLKVCIWLTLGLILAVVFSSLWFGRIAGALTPADAILVLGAGLSQDDQLDAATRMRVEAGVALYKAELAPVMVMSGGPARPGGPSAADLMAAIAEAKGVPPAAILREGRSTSTLQNAIFTAPILRQAGIVSVIAVTEGFHMARSTASLRWAGVQVRGAHVSTIFRPGSALKMIVREALAWPYNAFRVAFWHYDQWRGVPADVRDAKLR
ncbi:YdcF family protein [Algicella marina]|uniref:YdcF family protein n=1 Tax=Algicella marina TaxID=2683284 RepID=A0A6P1T0K6_9RHOB|nr:YdcF family protein [Algicella marina]QHQ35305.1 YdcF family protein [Algicella marina]